MHLYADLVGADSSGQHRHSASGIQDANGRLSQAFQQVPFPSSQPAGTMPQTAANHSMPPLTYRSDPFGQAPPANPVQQHPSNSPSFRPSTTPLPPYEPGFADASASALAGHQHHQQQGQNGISARPAPNHKQTQHMQDYSNPATMSSQSLQLSSSSAEMSNGQQPPRQGSSLQAPVLPTVHTSLYEEDAPPVIEGEDASDGRMLLVEGAAAARRGEGEDPEDDDNVTEHYRGASSGIPSLHALRHHSDDGNAHIHKRTRAYSTSASHLRSGQIDYYAGSLSEYSRNAVGYGDSLRTQADERGVFIEDEREHFTLPPIRLLSSQSGGDGLGSPNFPVHVPKGLFDRLIR